MHATLGRRWIVSVLVAALSAAGTGTPALASPVAAATPPAPGGHRGGVCATRTVPPRQGNILGIVPAAHRGGTGSPCAGNAATATASHDGAPPLLYGGGPVMGTAATVGEVTVTPIYWAPSGYSFPSTYEAIINGFLSNVSADSGRPTNVFASDTQYTDAAGSHIHYYIHPGAAIMDTDPFPTSGGCQPDTGAVYSDDSGYSACVDDAQLSAAVEAARMANGLPGDLGHMYAMFLPKGVESCQTSVNGAGGGTCSINAASTSGYCAYHSGFTAGSSTVIDASMPWPIYASPTQLTCSPEASVGNEDPTGDLDADVEISAFSHEVNEAITDPEGTAWNDSSGFEDGDECAYIYGGGFGGSPGALYNQTINGSHYFVQEEFSNEDFNTDVANSCIQQEDPPTAAPTVTTPAPVTGVTVAFDGSTSTEADNPGGISSWSWDFGDASPPLTGATTQHTYASAGTYLVRLTVTDVDLFQTTATTSVTVSAPGFLRVTTSPAVPSQVAVDGRINDTWALNYLPIAPGNHVVCLGHDIEGYDTPACQTVAVTSGQDTFVTGTFVPRGFLEVGTNPCCMQDAVITVDGVARDDNTMYTDLAAGAHTVCWGPVANETPPPCQGVTLVGGQTLTVIGNYTSTPGSGGPPATDGFLRVTTSPAVPSQIAVDGVARDTWALNYLRIGAGSHTVCFWRNIEGFDTPACQTVSVTSGQNTFVVGTYVPRGFLEVGTSPSAIGAVISVDGAAADKDVVYTDIPVGTHAVCWAPVAGMTAPACQNVAVTAGQTTVVIGTYG